MTSTITQCTPADLFANLPGILGFYPRESLVLATFNRAEHAKRFLLGPVMRLDIGDPEALNEVAEVLRHEEPDLVFGFLITTGDEDSTEQIALDLYERVATGHLDLSACWTAREVLTGEPYQLVFGPGEEQLTRLMKNSADWKRGKIAPVSSAIAMEPLLRNGQLPELERSAVFDHFNRFNPLFDAAEASALESFATRHAAELCVLIDREAMVGEGAALGAVIADFRLLLAEIEETGMDSEALMGEEETLVTVAVYLSDSLLRDAVLSSGLKYQQAALALSLAVARTFGGTIRANALSIYAVVAVAAQLSMQVAPALFAAQREVPGHTLSSLLLDGAQAGVHEAILEATRRGSELVAEKYRVPQALRTNGSEPGTE